MDNRLQTILLVEDNPDHLELIRRAFEEEEGRYRLHTVGFLSEARKILKTLHPDLIISDYRLPDGVGTDLVERGSNNAALPLVLLTSFGDEKLAVSAMKSGILDYVVKSEETFADLPRIAARSIREWRNLQERISTEQHLRDSQEKLATIFAHAPVTLWTTDGSGVFLYWQGRQSLYDQAAGTVFIGQRADLLFADRPEILANFRRALAGEAFTAQEQWRQQVLETRYQPIADESGRVCQVIGVSTDVTDRIQALEDLRRMHAAIEQSDDEVILTDQTGRVTYLNPAAVANLGNDRSQAIGASIRDLHGKGPPLPEELWPTLAAEATWKGRITGRKQSGAVSSSDVTISPIRSGNGSVIGFVWIKRDVTARLVLEKQLIQSQKMEAIGTLANGIAHDFNNILAAIVGYTEMAMLQTPLGSDLRTKLQRVLQAGERAGHLVRQILTFSRHSPGEAIRVEVRLLVKEAVQLLRATIPPNISIVCQPDSDACMMADPTHIHQIVMNLCTNAVHAMSGGGTLTICLEDITDGQLLAGRFASNTPSRCLRLTVADTGGGIAPEHLDRIFDPFFTTKLLGKGTGLGLSVVSTIVSTYSGFIDVDNRPGSGATFHVYLPADEGIITSSPISEDPPPGGKEHILFVDDEPFLREIGEQFFQILGYRVTACEDSSAALSLFRNNPTDFDLLLSDLLMPGLDGEKLATEVLSMRPELPVVICSGLIEPATETRLKALGIRAIIQKPLVIHDLAKVVRQALNMPALPKAAP